MEKRRVEPADVAKSHRRAGLESLVELGGLAASAVSTEVPYRTEEDSKEMVDGLEGGKLLASRVGLGAYVFQGLACIEPHNVIFVLILAIAEPQTS